MNQVDQTVSPITGRTIPPSDPYAHIPTSATGITAGYSQPFRFDKTGSLTGWDNARIDVENLRGTNNLVLP